MSEQATQTPTENGREGQPARVLVLVSGAGSNLRALQGAIREGSCAASIVGVLSDKRTAKALAFADAEGIPTEVISPKDFADRTRWDEGLADVARTYAPDLVILAGFMRILGRPLLSHFGGRIINVHPSLLPAFPGIDGPGQAIKGGVRVSGCTVHLVDEGVDTGRILAQAVVPVLPNDDATTLHARIQVQEHRLLPAVVNAAAQGRLGVLRAESPDASGAARGIEPAEVNALLSPTLEALRS